MQYEANIQRAGCDWLKKQHGCLCIKISTSSHFGTRGWPDYLNLTPFGTHFFIEYKTPTGRLTKLQAQRIADLRDKGHEVYVCHSTDEVKNAWMEHAMGAGK